MDSDYCTTVKAKHRLSKDKVVIKMIKFDFYHREYIYQVTKELQILKHLSDIPDNIFTVKLQDILIPGVKDEIFHEKVQYH